MPLRVTLLLLTGSVALNLMLGAFAWSSGTAVNELGVEMDRLQAFVKPLLQHQDAVSRRANELGDELNACRVELIKRVMARQQN